MALRVVYKTRVFLEMIKFEHTLFALPFAYVGALLVQKQIPSAHNLIWITLAMVGARTAAMSLNRLIDRHIDALNPRTAGRALPRGLLSVTEVWLYVLLSFTLLLVSACQLSPLAFKLFPVAVAVLSFYSYTKRFTWTCHLFLGLALSLAPLGAWIAIANRFDLAPVLIASGVLFWVAGFDIIYACDDYDFDRRYNIHSIPARFGLERALAISSLFHIIAPAFFFSVAFILQLGLFYLLGVLVAVILLCKQHALVSPRDLSRAGVAFFNLNGTLSVIMFVFTLLDVLFPIRLF
ncbi:4-hydroxybenzoate octaprenyltransferase [Desulfofundulus thermobenzoicus]|uniref:4-hydroxybenzoate polyprenyltransferase n=1 Tax=Desulfofundulus thermobenzoicus TaxID=29376 RepID=A0A6N7IR99_9FIRM|nr:UbiA-like polyprenyltransferase [Desulfofundulus thermobenzoicus]MQL52049.1 4-hydroxybenzoate octaprenyltransferase [Desulfofundulus thermobenzoicus]HHW42305.1 UbiA family prenyltransferase [Desulfotomaculum sp.]